MKFQIVEEDIVEAYKEHATGWWLDPCKTPPAIALARLGYEPGFEKLNIAYTTGKINGKDIKIPENLTKYVLQFSYSLMGPLQAITLSAIKALHSTNTDFRKPITIPKTFGRVLPEEFEIED